MADNGAMQRRRIYFSGRVQGVGFRVTTCQIAASRDITGFVRNMNDARVLVVVEGQANEIDRFLAQLRQTMSRYIRDEEVFVEPATGEFDEFRVAYS